METRILSPPPAQTQTPALPHVHAQGPSRTPSPAPPIVQPDHFFGHDDGRLIPSPRSDGRTWLDPADDPLAHRGIPVFKPTMDEFRDFEGYMNKVEPWGLRSGIVKVIPPKEWTDALPSTTEQLKNVKIRTPIEQHMLGRGGLFRQENMEKRRIMSVREWAEMCEKDDFKTPGVDDVGLHARSSNTRTRVVRRRKTAATKEETAELEVKQEQEPLSPPHSPQADLREVKEDSASGEKEEEGAEISIKEEQDDQEDSKIKTKRTREAREAQRAAQDVAFLETFEPHKDWLPPNTTNDDYTAEFCQKLERQYWRNCGLGKPAWYGADTMGSLFTDDTKVWNVGHLPSLLSRILPSSSKGLPGVNTPYLYFGMWRATFAWHVEDMDLFSINYIHFGAPKFWYAVPQGRAAALEQTMKGYFPKDISICPQFLRHKSFLASPTLLAQSSCRPNFLVQKEQEFVITYPRGYHAGFNLGFNCAESVNFALDSWLDHGRKAKACQCVTDSVRIDVDQLLQDREAEAVAATAASADASVISSKRKAEGDGLSPQKRKKPKNHPPASASSSSASASAGPSTSTPTPRVTLKLGPRPVEETFPCCLCVSTSKEGLLRVQDPPVGRRDLPESLGSLREAGRWMAHGECAKIVPETWVDDVEIDDEDIGGERRKESRVFGVDGIVKDRWGLKCAACTKTRAKAHGAPIQCTKGKCAKSYHVSCARDGAYSGIAFSMVAEHEREVTIMDPNPPPMPTPVDVVSVTDDTLPASMDVDGASPPEAAAPEPRVLKVIKKLEVQVLCPQHNPEVAAAKKASKQDKVKNDLLALPPMSRIKVRVSSGVFEVSLVRVIEESKSIEVLWDRGLKREFKWGSVVFGQMDGQDVQQKPSMPAPEPPAPSTTHMAAGTYASVAPVAANATQGAAAYPLQPAGYSGYSAYGTSGTSGTWSYQNFHQQHQAMQQAMAYPYAGYYYPYHQAQQQQQAGQGSVTGAAKTTGPGGSKYRAQLQWQTPYTGPPARAQATAASAAATSAMTALAEPSGQETVGARTAGGSAVPTTRTPTPETATMGS